MEVYVIEIWRDIKDYEGLYEISNYGDVRNVQTGHVLSPGISQGYYYVALYKNQMRKNKQVNRLVAEAFIDNPDNLPLVHHIDENKTNNYVGNIEWRDYSYNNTYGDGHARRINSLKGHPAWNKGKKMPADFGPKVSEGMKKMYRNRLINKILR